MDYFPKIDGGTLAAKVKKVLLKLMKNGTFDKTGKLPPEEKLAELLGVSRTVVRDVLTLFETEGFITRRRGIGTVINPIFLKAVRLDLEFEFLELVEEAGYKPDTAWVKVREGVADEEACEKLGLSPGEEIFLIERLILADGIPAIHCIDHFSKGLVVDWSFAEQELKKPVFDFLKSRCKIDVYIDLTEIAPKCADETIAAIFKIEVGAPILYLDEIGFDIEQKPVLWSKEYHRHELFNYKLLRKRF